MESLSSKQNEPENLPDERRDGKVLQGERGKGMDGRR